MGCGAGHIREVKGDRMDFHGIRLPDKDEITTPGKKIYDGVNANVYEWGKDKVIKMFKASYPTEKITAEYYNLLAVKNLPFKKTTVVEMKKTAFGYGIVFDRLDGELLTDFIHRTGDLKEAAVKMAELQKSINKCTFDSTNNGALESAHQRLRMSMLESKNADSDATKEMIRFLGTMMEGKALCHGNLSPDNVLLTPDGPVALSGNGYCIGMPLYDVAKSFFLIAYSPLPGEEDTGDACPVCGKMTNMEERKEFGRHYLNAMGKSATQIGGYLSMIIAGM